MKHKGFEVLKAPFTNSEAALDVAAEAADISSKLGIPIIRIQGTISTLEDGLDILRASVVFGDGYGQQCGFDVYDSSGFPADAASKLAGQIKTDYAAN